MQGNGRELHLNAVNALVLALALAAAVAVVVAFVSFRGNLTGVAAQQKRAPGPQAAHF